MSRLSLSFATTAVLVGSISGSPAYAYLDPGTGSMLVQLLLGGVAGAVVILKLYWQRVKDFVSFRKPPQNKD